jgi:branched-chain amino acid aminotransferase
MAPEALVWLNGELVDARYAHLTVNDRGFTLADGVFETLRVREGRPLWLADHLARLHRGAALLGIAVPLDDLEIEAGLAALLAGYGSTDAALRLTLTRGVSARRGLWPPGDLVRPTFLATVGPLPHGRALSAVVAGSTRRNERSPLAGIKSLNYGDQLLARREAEARGTDEALLLNTAARLACASVSNVFLKLDGRWWTPPVADGALPGIARERLIRLARVEERSFSGAELRHTDAMVTTNSLRHASIVALDGAPLADLASELDLESLYR